MFRSGQVDWALGEAFAFGTLLLEGTSVRLAGQDSRRGTFSHRHATLIDYETEREHTPLAQLGEESGAHLWLYDSLLSEYAALGFEYGYTVVNKDALVMWEAQFGDFNNGAQIIIDQFLVAAEDKWGQTSGLTLLLPHGYEGQGPEHSSARIERFLTLAAEDNIQAANPTTSAQYFHLLRRQMARDVRKPLIVFTPKALLRARFSHSPVEAFTRGSFEEVLDDPTIGAEAAEGVRRRGALLGQGRRRRLRSTGEAGPRRRGRDRAGRAALPVALRRRWPPCSSAMPNAREVVWLQEEPENMGPWNGLKGRLYGRHGDTPRRSPGSAGWSRAAPPRATTRSTTRRRPSCSPRRSPA